MATLVRERAVFQPAHRTLTREQSLERARKSFDADIQREIARRLPKGRISLFRFAQISREAREKIQGVSV